MVVLVGRGFDDARAFSGDRGCRSEPEGDETIAGRNCPFLVLQATSKRVDWRDGNGRMMGVEEGRTVVGVRRGLTSKKKLSTGKTDEANNQTGKTVAARSAKVAESLLLKKTLTGRMDSARLLLELSKRQVEGKSEKTKSKRYRSQAAQFAKEPRWSGDMSQSGAKTGVEGLTRVVSQKPNEEPEGAGRG
jgi:hypothetical protein